MNKPIPGLEVRELDEVDSGFALLEHFGMVALPEPTKPTHELVLPAPAEVPAWDLEQTERTRMQARLKAGLRK